MDNTSPDANSPEVASCLLICVSDGSYITNSKEIYELIGSCCLFTPLVLQAAQLIAIHCV